jgi:ElaB/YqjD/DUF883 family membrane-anchored ribosome-binding protein
MNEEMSSSFEELESMASKVKQQVANAADTAKDSAVETGRALGRIDQQREHAARGLVKVASVLHEKADDIPFGEKASRVAHATADRFEDAADYIREHPLGAMMKDVEGFVRRYPGQSIAAAIIAGFFIGRLFHHEDLI